MHGILMKHPPRDMHCRALTWHKPRFRCGAKLGLWGKVGFVERILFGDDLSEVGEGVLTLKYPMGYVEVK